MVHGDFNGMKEAVEIGQGSLVRASIRSCDPPPQKKKTGGGDCSGQGWAGKAHLGNVPTQALLDPQHFSIIFKAQSVPHWQVKKVYAGIYISK